MRQPIQLTLNFHSPRSSQPQSAGTQAVPIDDTFPEDAANALATLEAFNKHLYRPNTYLHKWWARRSGTTFRYILKQLVSDSTKQDFYAPGGLEGKVILDPMMGGGTILHEAIRMGANVIGVDIDPIPVLQAKATLTISSLRHKQAIFNRFFDALRERLAPFYRTTCPHCDQEAEVQFILYGLRRTCSCREVVFVDRLLLRQDKDHDVYLCPSCREVYVGLNHSCCRQGDTRIMTKGTQWCEACGTAFTDILNEPFSQRYTPLVVVGQCPQHRQFFKGIAEDDMMLLTQAAHRSQQSRLRDAEHFQIPPGPKSDDLLRRGITSFRELFTPRQLLYLDTSLELLSTLPHGDRLWLALLLSTSLEFNSLLCGYKGGDLHRPGAIRHVFSHHAYSFPYTALENNPIFSGNTSGTLHRLFNDRIVRAGQWAIAPTETRMINGRRTKVSLPGEIDGGTPVYDWEAVTQGERNFLILQADSAILDIPEAIVDYVVTDPPYYDSVQYSDLSTFFRVWLRLFLPTEIDWCYNPLASAVSEGNMDGDRKYGAVLEKIWKMCFRALKKEHGRLIFTFHHWHPAAWAALTLSLKHARFVLMNRYVVFSENPISVHIRDLKALKHDTILVLKPDTGDEPCRHWPKPSVIDTSDSYTFCRDCGTALGWFLLSDYSAAQIRHAWAQLLEGKGNAKAAG
ncbi:MAG: hypothetical protein D6736_05465 [Nitrospinota bacterium]|nr:MAG: hypothetical protein D6736_05465 [Nitrospinota bacterium]